jgi:HSP20 family protein
LEQPTHPIGILIPKTHIQPKEDVVNLVRIEPRTSAAGALVEPFNLMRNLLRWDPFRELENVEGRTTFSPSFDIRENPQAYVFQADMPGVKLEDLDINLKGNRLTISGKRQAETRQEQDTWYTVERTFGSFCRTFALPEGVEASQVKAELRQGVLTLTVPKIPEVQPRKISVQGN